MKTLSENVLSGVNYASVSRKNRSWDIIFASLGIFVLFIAITTLVALFLDLAIRGAPQLSNPEFYTSYPSRKPLDAGILSAWVGTIMVMIVTAVVAIPLGIGAGLYLEEYANKNWLTDIIEINVSNLAGVPSIVYGLLALGLFVQTFGMGETVLVAGLVLALLILPIIIVSTREAVRSIPNELREAAYGLGANQWQTMSMYILPAAKPGIITGGIVGLSRAIGETAPIITIGALSFIAFLPQSPISGDFPFISFEWLNSGFTVMPIQMFGWVSRPQADFQITAAAAGVVLIAMTLTMNALAIYIRFRARK
ncbi:phosphate ABC transporter permease PstA [Halomonas vilamensis]|uniref:Phosphate transport system permease protein PstA n=1 Tax=Vreelandella vilamensis TaxID=531309 RepID=A0ABU1H2L3_9GAMM|nr:phosphate ABC transporter permease PstA [Halomonas vilamensis]MDR5898545.1 phosphate ABC transporter permease PstA [Halomonas vilamensis]